MKILVSMLIFLLIITATAFADPSIATSKGITLYEQPDSKSKVVGTIAAGNALIPIFRQNNWLKVADPSNGNVGWVSNETLSQPNLPIIRTFSQTIIRPGSQNNPMLPANALPSIDEQQVQEFLRNWQVQQKNMGQALNQLFNQSIVNFNTLLRTFNEQEAQFANSPLLQPVQVTPATKATETQPAAAEKKPANNWYFS